MHQNNAALAHLVEHVPEEHGVPGSSPGGSTKNNSRNARQEVHQTLTLGLCGFESLYGRQTKTI